MRSFPHQISAARAVIGRCEFNEAACSEGIDGLEGWTYEWNPDLQVFSKNPLHDSSSHPSDAFAYGCQVMQLAQPKPTSDKARYEVMARPDGRMVAGVTVNELFAAADRKRSSRI